MRPREACDHLVTVRDVLRVALARLRRANVSLGHGTEDLFDEAAWLILWSLGLPPDRLEPFLDARLSGEEIRAALALVERRCTERQPTAYLTGEAWLRGLRFISDARALVPRSLIAELLDEDALAPWIGTDQSVESVLDLCTGGASLAIFAARRYPTARILGTDLSPDALSLARENLALYDRSDQIELRCGDLYAPVSDERFDLILSNPPYVNSRSMAKLAPEFRAEPAAALEGGTDGMHLIRTIVGQAAAHLKDSGILVIEIGHEARHFEAAFEDLRFTYLPTASSECSVVLIERADLL